MTGNVNHRLPHLQRRWATRPFWIPAFAGMTEWGAFPLPDVSACVHAQAGGRGLELFTLRGGPLASRSRLVKGLGAARLFDRSNIIRSSDGLKPTPGT